MTTAFGAAGRQFDGLVGVPGGSDIKYEEIGLVLFILGLWIMILRIFFLRWGNMI